MHDKTSHKEILRSSSIVGAASLLNIISGIVRTKVLAISLGPALVGVVSIYVGLISTAVAMVTMGMGTVGTREVARAISQESEHALKIVRRAMFWGTLLLAGAGAMVVWSLREVIAITVLGGIENATVVGWLALGVALSVASVSQGAIIQGMRRIGDMARLSVYASLLNTLLGVALLWYWGAQGLIAFVLIGPFINFLLGHWYVSRLPKANDEANSLREIFNQLQTLLRLGIPLMGASLVVALVNLWIRVVVGNTFGSESLGQFHAASTISSQYLGFVLAAMAVDYYPRLTSVIGDNKAATRLVNEQTEIALLLSAPVLTAMIGCAPWVIQILYSTEFMSAVAILRWQILGDVLKVASWPLGFIMLAAGANKTYFFVESFVIFLTGSIIAIFSSIIGLQITGISFLICYVVYLPIVYVLAKHRIGFQWSRTVTKLLTLVFISCTLTALFSALFWWGFIVSLLISLTLGAYTLGQISRMSNLGGRVGEIGKWIQRLSKILT